MNVSTSPKDRRKVALERQIARLDSRIANLQNRADRVAWIRLVIFLGGFAAAGISYFAIGLNVFLALCALTIIGFAVAVGYHRRLRSVISAFATMRGLKKTHIARMTLDWQHIPPSLFEAEHPLAVDLDLIGERSIHHLVDAAATYEASQLVRDWLLDDQPELATIAHRQQLVQTLWSKPLFVDKLRAAGFHGETTYRPGVLTHRRWRVREVSDWFVQHIPHGSVRGTLIALIVLAIANAILYLLFSFAGWPRLWLLTGFAYLAILLWGSRRYAGLLDEALDMRDALSSLGAVFHLLENSPHVQTGTLKEISLPFHDSERKPSAHLRRISWVASAVSFTHVPGLWLLINSLIPWDAFFAHLLDRYKQEMGVLLPKWIDAWFELEALSSLATFGYLNPAYTMPTLSAALSDDRPLFDAIQVGHPLLHDDRKVCNDFQLTKLGKVITITGSNMAGKSTFLRTLGINLALAYAGGPVNADRLLAQRFRLFTCIRVSDSVTDGYSYFYAEVRRLKALLVALNAEHALPLFFLIDEIFRGTNNRERLIGSRSYIRALAGRNGVGVISTHDLELTKLADEIPNLENYHFREEVVDGSMIFDYTLRHGPCPTTNALKIMQLEGLPVDAL